MKRLNSLLALFLVLLTITSTALAEGLLDDLDDYVDEITEEEEQLKSKPFQGSLFKDKAFGQAELRGQRYDIGVGIYFSYWVFPGTDADLIAEIIRINQEEFYFTHRTETIDDLEFDVLIQFGKKGKEVWIASYKGVTILLIEDEMLTFGLPAPIPAQYVQCTKCNGTGSCQGSTCTPSGKCDSCHGKGKPECSYCDGLGWCSKCYGTGSYNMSSGRLASCAICSATGDCLFCDGEGVKGTCYDCWGSGRCSVCSGTGKCKDCKGDGNMAN